MQRWQHSVHASSDCSAGRRAGPRAGQQAGSTHRSQRCGSAWPAGQWKEGANSPSSALQAIQRFAATSTRAALVVMCGNLYLPASCTLTPGAPPQLSLPGEQGSTRRRPPRRQGPAQSKEWPAGPHHGAGAGRTAQHPAGAADVGWGCGVAGGLLGCSRSPCTAELAAMLRASRTLSAPSTLSTACERSMPSAPTLRVSMMRAGLIWLAAAAASRASAPSVPTQPCRQGQGGAARNGHII